MSDIADTEARVREIIRQHTGAPEAFSLDNTLEDLGADSLEVIEISMSVEEEFGVRIDDDEVGEWKTAADVLTTVNRA